MVSVRPDGHSTSIRSALRRGAEAEMGAQVVLTQIARARLDVADLRPRSRRRAEPARRSRRCCSPAPRSRTSSAFARFPPSLRSSSAAWPLLVTSRSRSPSLSMSPAASPRPTFSAAKPGPTCGRPRRSGAASCCGTGACAARRSTPARNCGALSRMCPLAIAMSSCASLSKSRNATPKPTNGSVGKADAALDRSHTRTGRARGRDAACASRNRGW